MNKFKALFSVTVLFFCFSCSTEDTILHVKLKTDGGDVIFSVPINEVHVRSRTDKFFSFRHVLKALDCNDEIKDVDTYIFIQEGNNYSKTLQARRIVASHEKPKNGPYGLDLYDNSEVRPNDYLLASVTETFIFCNKNANCSFRGNISQYIGYRIYFDEKYLSCWQDIENSSLRVINNYYYKGTQ